MPAPTTSPNDETPQAGHHRVCIPDTAPPTRLDKALAAAVPSLSRARIQALIASGQVSCGGRTITDAAATAQPGMAIDILVPAPMPAVPEAQDLPLAVVYEDDALIVIDKPAGMVVHPAAGNENGTLVNALLAHCGDSLSGIGGVKRPGIVHRLDKETSGLMVVAKSDRAHAALSQQFADRTLSRTYQALVWGMPAPREGRVDAPIGRSPNNRKKMAVVSNGKPAATRYRVIRPAGPSCSLVACTLETGRTHQIRVHMSSIGHPIVGDPTYGHRTATRARRLSPDERAAALGFPRQALHAAELTFAHPDDGEARQFTAPLPDDFATLLTELTTI